MKSFIILAVICLATVICDAAIPRACATMLCPQNTVCVESVCVRAPCEPGAYCAPKISRAECPPPTDRIGICIAECTYDSECDDGYKCCGSCPRTCQKVVNLCQALDCQPGYICRMRNIRCFKSPCPTSGPYCAPIKKPGLCPRSYAILDALAVARCNSECKNDQQCSGRQKCCGFGPCERRCKDPVTTIKIVAK